ncbi:MAG: molybdate ABC transporter substrate-binding protein [Pseudomonadota bacterium]|nr:molybdate ABC transporter substrate-binding protein [Pseudomonadota bacterium]
MPSVFRLPLVACCLALLSGAHQPARAGETLVAVAANYAAAARATAELFAEHGGHQAIITTGSTGKLFAQIAAGAPFEVLLAADTATPERLEREDLAVQGSRFTYATGRLALWSADPAAIGSDGRAVLASDAYRHIAIANPDLAPYGVAAREALRAMGLWDLVQPRIVMGQNIGQTFALVRSGNAELGLVAWSALRELEKDESGSTWVVPSGLHPPIRQDAVLLTRGADNPAARAFLAFLRGTDARAIAADYGYGVD